MTKLALLLSLPIPALAATHTVPGDYWTLQEAVDGAKSGDKIVVAVSYRGSDTVVIDNKILTIESAGLAPATLPSLVIVDSAVHLDNINGLSGYLPVGGDVERDLDDRCTGSVFDDCLMEDGDRHAQCVQTPAVCAVDSEITGTDLTLASTWVQGLVASGGSVDVTNLTAKGFTVFAPLSSSEAAVTVTGCHFEGNAYGAVVASGGTLDLTDCDFIDNGWRFLDAYGTQGADLNLSGVQAFWTRGESLRPQGVAGGSVYVDGGRFEARGVIWTDPSAAFASVLYAPGDSVADILIEGATVRRSATTGTGAILVWNATLDIRGSSFADGTSAFGAVALGAIDSSVHLDVVDIQDYTVTGHDDGVGGGAIALSNSALTGKNLTITGLSDVSKVTLGGGLYAWESNVVLIDSDLADLRASAGGGVAVVGGELSMDRVSLTGLSAGSSGGALYVARAGLSVIDSDLSNNSSPYGGAAYVAEADPVTIRDSRWIGNEATAADSGATGGALLVWAPGPTALSNNAFCANTTTGAAGAVAISGDTTPEVVATNNLFLFNTADQYAHDMAFASNLSPGPPDGPRIALINNTVVGTGSANSYGIGALWAYQTHLDVTNNIIQGSYAGATITIDAVSTAQRPTVEGGHNLWWDNTYYDVSDETGSLPGAGAVFEDPRFVSLIPGDCASVLWLDVPSPARDAGDPSLADPDGSRSDIGAYGGPGSPLPDRDLDGWAADLDCDDADPATHPSAAEVCDDIDNDCNGFIDDGAGQRWYPDVDGDGWGSTATVLVACRAPAGHVARDGDCDDDDPGVHPQAVDVPNDDIDQDCDGRMPRAWVAGGGCAIAPGLPGWVGLTLLLVLPRRRRRPRTA